MAASALFMVSMTAAQACGDLDAAMTEVEASAARPPLARILQRMGGDTVALMEKWSDPLMLLQAFAVYGQRAYGIYRRNHPSAAPRKPPEARGAGSGPQPHIPPTVAAGGDPGIASNGQERDAAYYGIGSF